MKERRYKEDYRLESYVDDRGRERRRAVYRGKWYEAPQAKRLRLAAPACALAFAACFLIYMKLGTPGANCMYVLPVASLALFPLIYWVMGAFSLYTVPQKMTRVQKETSYGRVLRSSVSCAALTGAACVGDLVYMLVSLRGRAVQELWGFAVLVCAAAAAFGCFRTARETFNSIRETGAPEGGKKA